MLNLTNDERKAVLFLIFVFLSGLGINFTVKQFSPQRTVGSFTQDLGKINLNTADKKLLMSMPGIGERLSQRIIDFREARGGFESVDEIKSIKGITEKRFEKVKDCLIAK